MGRDPGPGRVAEQLRIVASGDLEACVALASQEGLDVSVQEALLEVAFPYSGVEQALALNPSTSPGLLERLAASEFFSVAHLVAVNPSATDTVIEAVMVSDQGLGRVYLASQPHLGRSFQERLAIDASPLVWETLAKNPDVLSHLARPLVNSLYGTPSVKELAASLTISRDVQCALVERYLAELLLLWGVGGAAGLSSLLSRQESAILDVLHGLSVNHALHRDAQVLLSQEDVLDVHSWLRSNPNLVLDVRMPAHFVVDAFQRRLGKVLARSGLGEDADVEMFVSLAGDWNGTVGSLLEACSLVRR